MAPARDSAIFTSASIDPVLGPEALKTQHSSSITPPIVVLNIVRSLNVCLLGIVQTSNTVLCGPTSPFLLIEHSSNPFKFLQTFMSDAGWLLPTSAGLQCKSRKKTTCCCMKYTHSSMRVVQQHSRAAAEWAEVLLFS